MKRVPTDAVSTVARGLRELAAAARCTLYRRLISPALPPPLQVLPDLLDLRGRRPCVSWACVRGSIVAAWRLVRCNPWSHGGVDELADRRLFRDRPTATTASEAVPA